MSEKQILQRIVYVCIGLIIASIVTSSVEFLDIVPSPNDWLVDWTTWIGSVVVIVVGARVFWVGGRGLRKLIDEGPFWRTKPDNKTGT